MAMTTYGPHKTNIDEKSELYEYLVEINKKVDGKLIIERANHTSGFFRKKESATYAIYWDIGFGEYQRLFGFESLDSQDVLCYLIGILTGMDKSNTAR